MSLDLKIKGGAIIDGSGAERYAGDIGIADGRVVEIGTVSGAAKRTIDAEGALVTPGFIDMHTHYDAQVMWDSELLASTRNGVTTAVSLLLAGVEDIPIPSLDAALDWSWRSFGSYLDKVAETPHAINIAANVTHAPIRLVAMGERAIDGSAATPDDIATMQALLAEALESGASAFSTGRVKLHQLAGGGRTPDWHATREEVLALTATLAKFPGRPMQFASDFGMLRSEEDTLSELQLLRDITAMGVPVFTPLQQYAGVDGGWRRLAKDLEAMNAGGAKISFEASARAIAQMMGLELPLHPFTRHPSYMAIEALPFDERIAIMRTPEFRARLLAEQPEVDPTNLSMIRKFDRMIANADHIFACGETPDYEPHPSTSIRAIAAREGKSLWEVFYETLTAGDGKQLLYFPLANFDGGNLDQQQELLSLPDSLFSFGDAGAHLAQICDSAYSSFTLAHWGRDRAKGGKPGMTPERLVQQMTGAQAGLFGFKDRGTIALGSIADINIIDHGALTLESPEMLYDLPGGARRLLQCATGYVATFVGGVAVVEGDKLTGEMPGQVLRQ